MSVSYFHRIGSKAIWLESLGTVPVFRGAMHQKGAEKDITASGNVISANDVISDRFTGKQPDRRIESQGLLGDLPCLIKLFEMLEARVCRQSINLIMQTSFDIRVL